MLDFSAFLISLLKKLWIRPFFIVSPLSYVCNFLWDGFFDVSISASSVISLILGRLLEIFMGEISVLQTSLFAGRTNCLTWLIWLDWLIDAVYEWISPLLSYSELYILTGILLILPPPISLVRFSLALSVFCLSRSTAQWCSFSIRSIRCREYLRRSLPRLDTRAVDDVT
jgi:hypothetical protein